MTPRQSSNRRTIVVILTALATLIVLVVVTGGGFPTSSSPTPAPPPPVRETTAAPAPTNAAVSPAPLNGRVQAQVAESGAHTYTFTYIVHNGGSHAIAGFQINGGRANLFHITGPAGWNRFGEGVCGGHYPNVLIYWSTGTNFIQPGKSARFTFQVRTTSTTSLLASLSAGPSVQFSHVPGPGPSSLPAAGSCR